MAAQKGDTYKRARCAISGRFITLKEAARRPDTTIIETVRRKRS
jgi:hypothetical protein